MCDDFSRTEQELYIEDLDKSFLFIVNPSTGLSQLCKTFDRFKPDKLDFRLNAFLIRCIRKQWVEIGEPDTCNLTGDDLLKTIHGTITLVPDVVVIFYLLLNLKLITMPFNICCVFKCIKLLQQIGLFML